MFMHDEEDKDIMEVVKAPAPARFVMTLHNISEEIRIQPYQPHDPGAPPTDWVTLKCRSSSAVDAVLRAAIRFSGVPEEKVSKFLSDGMVSECAGSTNAVVVVRRPLALLLGEWFICGMQTKGSQ